MTVDDVHKRILQLMEERGWSGYKLASESDVSMSTYYNMVQRDTMPKIETLEKICNGFQITLSDFFHMGDEINAELSIEEKKLIKDFREADRSGKDRIVGYVDAIREMSK